MEWFGRDILGAFPFVKSVPESRAAAKVYLAIGCERKSGSERVKVVFRE